MVPWINAVEKKLNGTKPHSTNTAKCGILPFAKTAVKTNVSTPIMMMGLSKDQKTPRDMFRYRTRKSFEIKLESRNR